MTDTSAENMTVIALDPGYDRLGWAIGQLNNRQLQISSFGIIQTQKSEDIFDRYQQLDTELTQLLLLHHPHQAAIETLFFSNNQTTAMRVSEVRGLLISTLLRHQVKCFEYNPSHVKLTVTGYGRADKKAVEKMVRLQLKLPDNKLVDDTLDALAILLTHSLRSY